MEALVGPYKLSDTSFRTLCGHGWLSDEVIDAYLYLLLEKSQIPAERMDAVVASSIFHRGQYRAVLKMALPEASICMCPVNVGGHWLLVVVRSDHREIVVIDPMGREKAYERRLLRNWRNFLKAKKASQRNWRFSSLPHLNQQDSSSCGVLILKFAEQYLKEGSLRSVGTGHDDMQEARLAIATTLLPHKDKVEDYCVSCNMLDHDGDQKVTYMIQCDFCPRWTHNECAPHFSDIFKCQKCQLN